MAEILRGKAVADSLTEINRGKVEELKRAGILRIFHMRGVHLNVLNRQESR